MAKVPGNQLAKLSGLVDGVVFRQTRDGVVAARQPRKPLYSRDRKKPTEAQAAQQKRFHHANLYAKRVLDDPLARRAYERLGKERNRRFDRMVASDFLTPPEIEHVELSGYRGRRGDVIRILAHDDVEVVSVHVQIHTTTGTLVEEGDARSEHGVWNYAATVTVAGNDYLVITVTAQDRPENRTTTKVLYP